MCFGIVLVNSKAVVLAKKFLQSLVVKLLNLTEGATLESVMCGSVCEDKRSSSSPGL